MSFVFFCGHLSSKFSFYLWFLQVWLTIDVSLYACVFNYLRFSKLIRSVTWGLLFFFLILSHYKKKYCLFLWWFQLNVCRLFDIVLRFLVLYIVSPNSCFLFCLSLGNCYWPSLIKFQEASSSPSHSVRTPRPHPTTSSARTSWKIMVQSCLPAGQLLHLGLHLCHTSFGSLVRAPRIT